MRGFGEIAKIGHFWPKLAIFDQKLAKMAKFRIFLQKAKPSLFNISRDYVSCKKSKDSDARISWKMNPNGQRTDEQTNDADTIGLNDLRSRDQ